MYLNVNQQDLIFGLTITPGEGVEDVTAQYIASGEAPPAPGLGPAAASDKPLLDTSGTVQEETVEPLIGDAGGTFKVGSVAWYRSPWLWGGAALLVAAGVTAVWWSRREAR